MHLSAGERMMKNLILFLVLSSCLGLFGNTITGLILEENIIIDNLIITTVTDIYDSFKEVPLASFMLKDGRKIEDIGMYFESDIDDKESYNLVIKVAVTELKLTPGLRGRQIQEAKELNKLNTPFEQTIHVVPPVDKWETKCCFSFNSHET